MYMHYIQSQISSKPHLPLEQRVWEQLLHSLTPKTSLYVYGSIIHISQKMALVKSLHDGIKMNSESIGHELFLSAGKVLGLICPRLWFFGFLRLLTHIHSTLNFSETTSLEAFGFNTAT